MAATLDDLISPESPDEVLSYLLTELANVGFPTTAWQTGGVVYTLLRAESLKISDKVKLIAAIAMGGLLDLSTGKWLTLLAKSHYQLDRYLATFAVGNVLLSIPVGSPGQTLAPGQVWIKDNLGHRYNAVNTAPVTIAAGSSAVVPFRAENPGAGYNVGLGTGLSLITALPGMTAAFSDTGAGTWLTVQGSDDELDEPLRVRCRTRWATIGIQKTKDAFIFLATNTPGITTQPNRTFVDDQNPRGPNTVNVWIAGPTGPLSSSDATAISNYIVARKSPCSDIQVANAVTLGITINANVFYNGAFANAIADATDNLTSYINALAIGDKLYFNAVVEKIMDADGVINVTGLTVNSAAADLALAVNQVAVITAINLTPILTNG